MTMQSPCTFGIVFSLVPSTEPEPVLSKTSSVQTSSNDEKLDNPETLPVHVIPKEVKTKSITRSSLGIKRLSHKN